MFSHGEDVLVLMDGSMVKGQILAVAKSDEGKYAYEVQAPNNALGAPTRYFKGGDVFRLEQTPDERLEAWNKVAQQW